MTAMATTTVPAWEVLRDAALLPGLTEVCVAVLEAMACVPDAEAVVALPFAFARNASNVLPVAGALMARTMPCLQ